ncbi:MAG: undecaprenyldiphospho-muramoylpentapeptide beta-N-acetylglucosaminyltransferase [Acidimicrobiales bacterium]|nr:MAG: undecaprenyldiphospho-muramoylpentapeptide beta-N-acetylglucosaminyltransferase [Acidimicrobiales bacterium]
MSTSSSGGADSLGATASLRSVVLAGGGTGGHIEPALALAQCLRRHDRKIRITCLGTPKGLESELIPARGWDLRLVSAYPLPRRPNLDLLRTPGRIRASMRGVREVLADVAADVVVGFGGYVAVPAYLAAWRHGTPIVAHEVNSPAGIANRLGARLTSHVALGADHVKLRGGRLVGIPLRPEIATLDRAKLAARARSDFGLDPARPTLLVFGGSQGARSLNIAVAAAAELFGAAGIQILHVIGARNSMATRPTEHGVPYVTLDYVDRMDLAYAAADLALCRAGALSCAELAAVGLPAVYAPLPWGNGEQRRNALPVVRAGGGLLVEDSALSAEWLHANVVPLLHDPTRLAAMSAAAASYGRRDGDEALRSMVYEAFTAAEAGRRRSAAHAR